MSLPLNGIYFFYEEGEIWGHGGARPRIVRIGTSKDGNFRNRIEEHFLLDETKMNLDKNKPPPSARSIFRKNIGRVLLNKRNDPYLEIWNVDLTKKHNREKYRKSRDIPKEIELEAEITAIIRGKFSFRFFVLEGQKKRMGREGLETSLIGTVARCELGKPSEGWLGRYSPVKKINSGKLWQVQNLEANTINEDDQEVILDAIEKTVGWNREVGLE